MLPYKDKMFFDLHQAFMLQKKPAASFQGDHSALVQAMEFLFFSFSGGYFGLLGSKDPIKSGSEKPKVTWILIEIMFLTSSNPASMSIHMVSTTYFAPFPSSTFKSYNILTNNQHRLINQSIKLFPNNSMPSFSTVPVPYRTIGNSCPSSYWAII